MKSFSVAARVMLATGISVAALCPVQAGAQQAGAAGAQNATAEDAPSLEKIPDIVVTADRSAKTIQKTPIAISVVTGDQVQQEGRTKLDDVLVNQPAVVVQGAAKGFLVSIRGLGLSLPAQNGQGAVSTNYDGVYNSRGESAAAGFYDLDRVEVLRGPQSTLYGRTAIGGVLNVNSRDPRLGRFEGYAQGEVGNYDLYRGEGAINVPIGDKVALRASAAGVHRDGYLSNGHDDNKAFSARVKLLVEPSASVRMLAGVEYAHLGGKGPGAIPIANFPDNKLTTDDPSLGYQDFESWKYWLSFSADIGPGQLQVLPSYIHADGVVLGAFGGNFSYGNDPKKSRQRALELRYASQPGSPVNWSVGYYYYRQYTSQNTISGACNGTNGLYVPPDGFTQNPNDTAPGVKPLCFVTPVAYNTGEEIRRSRTDGAYGQATVPVTDRLRLILGARYSWEGISGSNDLNEGCFLPRCATIAPNRAALTELNDRHFDYRAGVEYDVAPNSLAYFTVASGYRQGGYSFGIDPDSFGPEKMKSFEVGAKNRLFDGKLLLNVDAFYYDYDSYQLVLVVPAPAGVSPPFALSIDTTPAREFGVEGEAAIALSPADRLNLAVTYLDSRILGTSNFRNADFPNTPKWTVKGGYSHQFTLGSGATLTPRIDGRYLSAQTVYPRAPGDSAAQFAESTQNAYFSGDLFLSFSPASDRWGVTAYLKNFTDKAIKQSDFFGYVQIAAPRTIGATFNVKF